MSHLAKLKLNERTRADVKQTPEQRLRAKLVDHLKLQKEIAEADLKGELINKTRLKFVRDEATGETRRIAVMALAVLLGPPRVRVLLIPDPEIGDS